MQEVEDFLTDPDNSIADPAGEWTATPTGDCDVDISDDRLDAGIFSVMVRVPYALYR